MSRYDFFHYIHVIAVERVTVLSVTFFSSIFLILLKECKTFFHNHKIKFTFFITVLRDIVRNFLTCLFCSNIVAWYGTSAKQGLCK